MRKRRARGACNLMDDGYSGANADYPGFQQMLADMENGERHDHYQGSQPFRPKPTVNRPLHRRALSVFGVRYIAIHGNVDAGNTESSDLMPFKNLFDEWYIRGTGLCWSPSTAS